MQSSIVAIVVVGLLAAGAKLIFLAKLGAFRRVLAFDAFLDVFVGSVFGFLFYHPQSISPRPSPKESCGRSSCARW